MKDTKLAKKLKELRKAHAYTQDYVASAIGIVRQTYSHYENGNRKPNIEILYKLAGLYEVSVDDLAQLTIDIDREVCYDAPTETQSGADLKEYVDFFNKPENQRKYNNFSNIDREMMFYFQKLSEEDKREMIEFTKIKARKKNKKK